MEKMWVFSKHFLYTLPVLLLLFGGSDSLKNVRAIVPAAVKRGEEAVLKCQYDLEMDNLYTVKWYRAEGEFYRYIPREIPPMKIFSPKGFHVVKSLSNASIVTIENVDTSASGRYRCEVSADAPSFLTYIGEGFMDVVDVPDHRPVITGVKARYPIGKPLRGNCTSKHSRPAANLTWYINGQQVNPGYIKRYKSHEFTNSEGLQTAILGIHFLVTQQHFHNGKLKIRCTASLYNVYWQSTEKSIEEERSKGGNMAGRNDGPGIINAPPESQHVALMYPVHGTALDPDPPPNHRDSGHALGGAQRINCCSFVVTLLLCVRTLRHLFTGELYNKR